MKQGLVVEFEHAVHVLSPEVERQVLLLLDAQLGLFEEDDDQAIERVDFILR